MSVREDPPGSGNMVWSDDHVIGRCSICNEEIAMNTKRSIGVDGYDKTATLHHDDCKERQAAAERHRADREYGRRVAKLLAFSGCIYQ